MIAALALAVAIGTSDCNLARRSFDSPLSYGQFAGWTAPRWVWHMTDIGESFVASESIHRAANWRRWVAGIALPAATVALHMIGHANHRYAVHAADWAFDVAVRSLPTAVSLPAPLIGVSVYAVSYAALFCYAEP